MIVTVLWRLEGQPESVTPVSFKDVDGGKYYAVAVEWASANGIIKGYDAESYGPDDNITREQLSAIMYRYASIKAWM
jgi:hypothetical protein